MSELPASVLVRDVSLRDGLQDEEPISTEAKVAIAEALVAAGVRDFELTSFVRPDRVPAMADAEALCAATQHLDVMRWGLVLNRRGAERALAAGHRPPAVRDLGQRHPQPPQRRRLHRRRARRVRGTGQRPRDGSSGAVIEMTLVHVVRVPVRGPDRSRTRSSRWRAARPTAGASSIGLADTIGVAMPTEVATLVERVVDVTGVPIGAHLHDTRGLALANALVAIEHGATRLDASVGGLGGCPFAPGASGNLPIEDLVHALDGMGVDTGCSVDGLIDAARLACDAVGRPVGSHVGIAGARFATPVPSPG